MNISLLRVYLEYSAHFLPWWQLGIVTEIRVLEYFEICDRDLYLIEVKRVGVYAAKLVLLLCLDELLEG